MACYGLSFKADISDLRESPSAKITSAISEMHLGRTLAVEPHIEELPKGYSAKIELVTIDQAFKLADIHVLLVNHSFFKNQKPKLKYLVISKPLTIQSSMTMFDQKVVMVTGGTGSFGQKFSNTIVSNHSNFEKTNCFSRDEQNV